MDPVATDTELLERFRGGDDAALGELYGRYEAPLFRFLFGVLKDHHAAEDALQETFIQALRHSENLGRESLNGWLFTVAYRQAMLTKRRSRKLPAPAEVATLVGLIDERSPAPDQPAEQGEERQVLLGLLAQLPPAQQEVIRLRVEQGMRFREVADHLGCPLNTALARMHAGLTRLRTLWEARHA